MSSSKQRERTLRISVCGLLLAIMLALGWLESMLPAVGVPGVKLGLSNSVLIFAVYMLDIPTGYILMALKVALSGFMFGNPQAMIYAFAGGLLSLTVMALLSRIRGLSPVVVSMAGGLAHNVGQVGAAMIVLQTPGLLYYMGILILVGLACGALTGVAAKGVMRHLRAARWHAPDVPGDRGAGIALILLSVAVVAVAGYVAYRSMHRPAGVVVTVEPAVTMIPMDSLSLPVPQATNGQ